MEREGGRRVLVVDDERDIRFMLRTMLEAFGEEVVGEAADGSEAIELARDLQPQVVILDLMMPGLNGFRALPELVQVSPDARIVVCTAKHLEPGEEQELRAGGAFDIVLKGTTLTRRLVEAIAA
jgi:two-component system chemotaxis response regulator CheY